jgi:hypothetical protein
MVVDGGLEVRVVTGAALFGGVAAVVGGAVVEAAATTVAGETSVVTISAVPTGAAAVTVDGLPAPFDATKPTPTPKRHTETRTATFHTALRRAGAPWAGASPAGSKRSMVALPAGRVKPSAECT